MGIFDDLDFTKSPAKKGIFDDLDFSVKEDEPKYPGKVTTEIDTAYMESRPKAGEPYKPAKEEPADSIFADLDFSKPEAPTVSQPPVSPEEFNQFIPKPQVATAPQIVETPAPVANYGRTLQAQKFAGIDPLARKPRGASGTWAEGTTTPEPTTEERLASRKIDEAIDRQTGEGQGIIGSTIESIGKLESALRNSAKRVGKGLLTTASMVGTEAQTPYGEIPQTEGEKQKQEILKESLPGILEEIDKIKILQPSELQKQTETEDMADLKTYFDNPTDIKKLPIGAILRVSAGSSANMAASMLNPVAGYAANFSQVQSETAQQMRKLGITDADIIKSYSTMSAAPQAAVETVTDLFLLGKNLPGVKQISKKIASKMASPVMKKLQALGADVTALASEGGEEVLQNNIDEVFVATAVKAQRDKLIKENLPTTDLDSRYQQYLESKKGDLSDAATFALGALAAVPIRGGVRVLETIGNVAEKADQKKLKLQEVKQPEITTPTPDVLTTEPQQQPAQKAEATSAPGVETPAVMTEKAQEAQASASPAQESAKKSWTDLRLETPSDFWKMSESDRNILAELLDDKSIEVINALKPANIEQPIKSTVEAVSAPEQPPVTQEAVSVPTPTTETTSAVEPTVSKTEAVPKTANQPVIDEKMTQSAEIPTSKPMSKKLDKFREDVPIRVQEELTPEEKAQKEQERATRKAKLLKKRELALKGIDENGKPIPEDRRERAIVETMAEDILDQMEEGVKEKRYVWGMVTRANPATVLKLNETILLNVPKERRRAEVKRVFNVQPDEYMDENYNISSRKGIDEYSSAYEAEIKGDDWYGQSAQQDKGEEAFIETGMEYYDMSRGKGLPSLAKAKRLAYEQRKKEKDQEKQYEPEFGYDMSHAEYIGRRKEAKKQNDQETIKELDTTYPKYYDRMIKEYGSEEGFRSRINEDDRTTNRTQDTNDTGRRSNQIPDEVDRRVTERHRDAVGTLADLITPRREDGSMATEAPIKPVADNRATNRIISVLRTLFPSIEIYSFVANENSLAPVRDNGIFFKGKIFVNRDSKNAELFTIGHELNHRLSALHSDFKKQAEKYILANKGAEYQAAYDKHYRAERAGRPNLSEERIIEIAKEEVIADLAGSLWADQEFWNELHNQSKPLFQRVLRDAIKILTDIINGLKNVPQAQGVVKDLEAFRKAYAKMVLEASKKEGGNVEATIAQNAPLFSRVNDMFQTSMFGKDKPDLFTAPETIKAREEKKPVQPAPKKGEQLDAFSGGTETQRQIEEFKRTKAEQEAATRKDEKDLPLFNNNEAERAKGAQQTLFSRKSDTAYLKAVESGDMETAQKMVDKAAKKAGYTIETFHGTTHGFNEFTQERANIENHFGKGYYFTDSKRDAIANYTENGADLTNRIEKMAERIEGNEELPMEQARAKAEELLKGNKSEVIPFYLKLENPLDITEDGTRYDALETYNEETDEYSENEDSLPMKLYNAINSVAMEYPEMKPKELWSDINENISNEWDGQSAYNIDKTMRESNALMDVSDENGDLASSEIIRKIYEEMGFDGIIMDADLEFGNRRKVGKKMEMDKGTKHYITFKSSSSKRSDPVTYDNNGKVIPLSQRFTDSNDIRYSRSETPFYSALSRAFESAKQTSMPAQQWSQWLDGNAPKMGVKKDEIEWSGIKDFLNLKGKEKLSKEDIQAYLEQNGVKVKEIEKGALEDRKLPSDWKVYQYGQDEYWAVDDANGMTIVSVKDSKEQAIADAKKMIPDASVNSKFHGYQLPGGKNYKELLLTLPDKNPRILSRDEFYEFKGYTFDQVLDMPKDKREELFKEWTTYSDKEIAKRSVSFKSSHFDEPNILAHVRMNERTDKDGNKVLFIEEIQSDWSSAKRKGQNVPSAPFINDTKAYVALALKRILRYAVDNGFDKVAWTSGEQQADRYDLSKQVDKVSYNKRGVSGIFEISIRDKKLRGKTGEWKFVGDFKKEELPGVIGKDLAAKIIKDSEIVAQKEYSGLDLKVGGEGMTAFYDNIVPQVANDVLKKIGDGKVEQIDVDGLGKQQGITITPEMSNKISEGLPLFSRASDEMFTTYDRIKEIEAKQADRRTLVASARKAQDGRNVTQIVREQRKRMDDELEGLQKKLTRLINQVSDEVFGRAEPLYSRLSPEMAEELYGKIEKRTNREGLLKRLRRNDQSWGEALKEFMGDILTPISTRISKLSESVTTRLRKFEYDIAQADLRDTKAILPWLQKFEKMSKIDQAVYDIALKNEDFQKVSELNSKYDMAEEWAKVRELLDDIYVRLFNTGFDLGHISEYFPRKIMDADGLLTELGSDEVTQGMIADEIAYREELLGRPLTVHEMAQAANHVISRSEKMIRADGSMKARKITIDEKLDKYYDFSPSAILSYISNMNKMIEMKKLADEVKPEESDANQQKLAPVLEMEVAEGDPNSINLDETIGNYIAKLIKENKLKPEQQEELVGLLKARFNYKPTDKVIASIKNLGYLTSMGSGFSSFITQIGDLAWAYYNSPKYATKALGQALARTLSGGKLSNKTITKEDLGIERMGEEFKTIGGLSKAVNKVFKYTFLSAMDNVGKETLINSAFDKYQSQAKKNDPELMTELQRIFGDEAEQVASELAAGDKHSDNVKFLLFNKLLNFQPISMTEMPKSYLTSPRGRIFYALKTFTIKQLDVFRREGIDAIANAKTPAEKAKAVRNLMILVGLVAMANGSADEIKDWLFKRKTTLSDKVIDNLLRLVGVSRYTVWEARRNGLSSAIWNLVKPPLNVIELPLRDIGKVNKDLSDGEPVDFKNFESWGMVPFFGKHYDWWFGAARERQIKKQEKNSPYSKAIKDARKKYKEYSQLMKDKKYEEAKQFRAENPEVDVYSAPIKKVPGIKADVKKFFRDGQKIHKEITDLRTEIEDATDEAVKAKKKQKLEELQMEFVNKYNEAIQQAKNNKE